MSWTSTLAAEERGKQKYAFIHSIPQKVLIISQLSSQLSTEPMHKG